MAAGTAVGIEADQEGERHGPATAIGNQLAGEVRVKPADLPPIEWRPLAFIPYGEAKELPPEIGWQWWDCAVSEMDAAMERQQAKGNV